MKEASPQLKSALLEAQAIGATRAEPSPWRVDPPVAPRRPASVVVHGDVRIDEYAWLRNREDPAVLAYLEAENAYTDAMMAPVDDLREQLFAELVGRIKEDDTTVPEERDGWLYYLRTETGRQYPSVCRRRSGAGQVIETIVLDQNARAVSEAFVNSQFTTAGPDSIDAETREELVSIFARLTPFLSAQGFTTVLAIYLWAAARIVHTSKRLPRPWPFVPELMMPSSAGLILIGAIIAASLFDGFIGALGMALSGAFLMAFALQGLAAVHDRTQGKSGRAFLLSAVYVLIFVTQGILMVALALFGIADTLFGLRRRFGSRPNPPPTPSP